MVVANSVGQAMALSDYADWWDGQKKVSEDALTDWVQANPQWWTVGIAGTLQTSMDLGAGMVDVLRFGEGMAEGGWRGVGSDALRLLVILGPLGRAGGMLARLAYLKYPAAIKLAVKTKGVSGPCTFTAVNNALSITSNSGRNLFLTARDAAKALGKPLKSLTKDAKDRYKLAAWIDDLVPFLRSNGARVRTFTQVNSISDAVGIARKGDGVVIFAIEFTSKAGKRILHSVIAVREGGRVKFGDYGGKLFNSLDELASKFGGGANADGIHLLKKTSGATLVEYELVGLMKDASSVMQGGIVLIEGVTAIETVEEGLDLAIPVFVSAVRDTTEDDLPPAVVKTSFEAFKAIKSGKPLIRLPEIHVTVRAPRSDWLTGVQFRLNAAGFGAGPVDGIMGPLTRGAVKNFQRSYGLRVDGIPGPITQAKLVAVCGY